MLGGWALHPAAVLISFGAYKAAGTEGNTLKPPRRKEPIMANRLFAEQVAENLRTVITDKDVDVVDVPKGIGITIRTPGQNCSPIFYTEPMEHMTVAEAAAEVMDLYKHHPSFSLNEDYLTKEYILANVVPVVLGNASQVSAIDAIYRLNEHPIIFKVDMTGLMPPEDGLKPYITVGNDVLEVLDITSDELLNAAVANRHKTAVVASVDLNPNFIMDGPLYADVPQDEWGALPYGLYIVGKGPLNSGFLLDTDLLETLSGGRKMLVIPSSIHEILVFKHPLFEMDSDSDCGKFAEWIKSVNGEFVNPKEQLGGNPYIFEDGALYEIIDGQRVRCFVERA